MLYNPPLFYKISSLDQMQSFGRAIGRVFNAAVRADTAYQGALLLQADVNAGKSSLILPAFSEVTMRDDMFCRLPQHDFGDPYFKEEDDAIHVVARYAESNDLQIRQYDILGMPEHPDYPQQGNQMTVELIGVEKRDRGGIDFVEHADLLGEVLPEDQPKGDYNYIAIDRHDSNDKSLGGDCYLTCRFHETTRAMPEFETEIRSAFSDYELSYEEVVEQLPDYELKI